MTAVSLLCLSMVACGSTPRGVLLDFTSQFCGPCRQMSPIVSKLQRQNYPIRKVDVNAQPDLAARYHVTAMPTFLLLIDGQEVTRIVGTTTESQLEQLLRQIPRSESETPEEAGVAKARGAPAWQQPSGQSAPRPGSSSSAVRLASTDVPQTQEYTTFGDSLDSHQAADSQPTIAHRKASPEASKSRFQLPFFPGRRPQQLPSVDDEVVVRAQTKDSIDPEIVNNAAPGPLSSSARIRVRDAGGVNYGSGTVVDSRFGRTLVLSCGHVFRHATPGALIEVDLFANGRAQSFFGQIVDFDLKADVGLVEIRTDELWPASHVASERYQLKVGDSVQSIGCGGGDPPTLQNIRVTALNRYVGPDNIECTGVPIQGRSGGGLFNRYGALIGVCIAADPEDRRGLYAGLHAIHDFLDQCHVGNLFRRNEPSPSSDESAPRLTDSTPLVPLVPNDIQDQKSSQAALTPASGQGPERPLQSDNAPEELSAQADGQELENEAGITPAELQQLGDAEVVCIIRPLNNPRAESRVVIIHRASPKFVNYLSGEVELQAHGRSGAVRSGSIARNESTRSGQQYAPRSAVSAESQTPIARLAATDSARGERSPTRRPMVEASLAGPPTAQTDAHLTAETISNVPPLAVSADPRPYRRSMSSRGPLQ